MLSRAKRAIEIAPIALRTIASRVIPGFKAQKVFAIGFNKTGTTSIHQLFKTHGYRASHAREWRNTRHPSIFMKYDAFSDGVPDDFRRLDKQYPGSKFILNVRDLDTWIDSRINYIHRKFPRGLELWDPFSDWNIFNSSLMEWVLQRNRYHAQVLQHFITRPEYLITINYVRDPQAADKISRFIGQSTSSEKPHINAAPTSDRRLQNETRIKRLLTTIGVAENEWANDIFCPSIDGLGQDFVPIDTSVLDEGGHWNSSFLARSETSK